MNIKIIKNKSKNYTRRSKYNTSKKIIKNISILLLALIFILGLLMGIFYFKNIVSNNYFEENPDIFQKIDLANLNSNNKLFYESIFMNITKLLFFWIIGLSILRNTNTTFLYIL